MPDTPDHGTNFLLGVASSAVGAGLALILARILSEHKQKQGIAVHPIVTMDNAAEVADLASRAIITAPHASCPPKHEEMHLCDLKAEVLAKSLKTGSDEILIGDIPRNNVDLNRDASASTEFQKKLTAKLEDGHAILLDAHSFPPGSHQYGNNDVALLFNHVPHAQRFAMMVADELTWKGYQTMVDQRHDYDYNVARVEAHGMPGVLIEVNEMLRDAQVKEVAETINRCRRAYFSEVAQQTFMDNPTAQLMPISWVFYHCDEHTEVGLCGAHPGQLWKHQFKKNLPLMDLKTGQIHGKMTLLPTGINDYQGKPSTLEVWNSAFNPTHRLGRLIGFQLLDGRQVVYTNGASLYTDASMTKLFAVEHNPKASIPGIQELQSMEAFEELKQKDELVAMCFTSETCPNCMKLKPKLPVLAGLFSTFVMVDVDDFPEIADKEGIHAVPKILVYARGKRLDEIKSLNAFASEVETQLGVTSSSVVQETSFGALGVGSLALPSLAGPAQIVQVPAG